MRSPVKTIVEAFSVLTGLSFIVSALLHEMIFAWWGISFIAAASIEDVVLGGIRLLFSFLAFGSAYGLGVLWARLNDEELVPPRGSAAYRIRLFIGWGGPLGCLLWLAYAALHPEIGARFGNQRIIVLPLVVAMGAAVCIAFLTSSHSPAHQVRIAVGKRRFLWLVTAALVSAVVMTAIGLAQRHEPLTLFVGEGRTHPCAAGADIRWIGTRAMVIFCAGRPQLWIYGDESIVLKANR
jgi:hypothetical protein